MNQDKITFIAKKFMEEDPEEYAGETIFEVIEQLKQTSEKFIEFTASAYGWVEK